MIPTIALISLALALPQDLENKCTKERAPVCGHQPISGLGKNFRNVCIAKAKGVTFWVDGECQLLSGCAAKITPVCGMDGKTYTTRCLANVAGMPVRKRGECPK
jgi:hypothetical protein